MAASEDRKKTRRLREDDPASLRATIAEPKPPSSRLAPASRASRVALGVGAVVLFASLVAPRTTALVAKALAPVAARPVELPAPEATASAPARAAAIAAADAELVRDGSAFSAGGRLFILPDFASSDGKMDVVVHFHGATDLVEQSYASVKLNAIVVVFNVGITSGAYRERFSSESLFQAVLDDTKAVLTKRHLKDASIRRVALSSFSAGFGAVEQLLSAPAVLDGVDSVLLFDSIHTSYDETKKLDLRPIEPFIRFAKAAIKGERLLFITHSQIPTLDYGSTTETTNLLLNAVGLAREAGGPTPALLDLPAIKTAVPKKSLRTLSPKTFVDQGGLFVRGYAGDKPEDHLSHLLQMASTALPALAERWRARPAAE